jgi:hypothetical protein
MRGQVLDEGQVDLVANALSERIREQGGGTQYLEAHHVIALAAQGPDTVHNVIALCSEHHREAHYGMHAEELERRFLAKLLEVRPPAIDQPVRRRKKGGR